ncbi:MAG: hypothetical protein KBC64_06960 [Simkaniaceae bacterium]|nr:hypothetical protein [Simkaniaceae bacterium]
MRIFLLSLVLLSFMTNGYGDQQQAMQQIYEEFVQIDARIERLVKQKLQLKAQVAQHKEREETSIRPRVDRRQNMQIEELSQQIQELSQQISTLDAKRSSLLTTLD